MPLDEKYLRLIQSIIPQAQDPMIIQRLSQLYDRVLITNEKINITSLVSPIDVTLKHFLDSLSLFSSPVFRKGFSAGVEICDFGCGGGFPGLPLACVNPEQKITMIDSTEKKIRALDENAVSLSLSGIVPVWGRGEELSAVKGGIYREAFDLCVSRAVAALPILCELCLPFVKVGGMLIAMKGQKAMEEVEDSRRAIPALGGVLKEVQEITFDSSRVSLSDFSDEEKEKIETFFSSKRYLVVIEKKKKTAPQYPRKWAQMVKKHL